MKEQFLEVGRIINTHGVRGEVKIEPWCDSPEWFCELERVFLDGGERELLSAHVHGRFVLARLSGVEDMDAAILLKNKVLYMAREDVDLEEGEYFLQDLIGMKAVDDDTGAELGTVKDVLEMPSGRIFDIRGSRSILIPDQEEFVRKIDWDAGEIRFFMMEGL